ncbi:MAG: hypothetical protein NTX76_03005 [Alphaproteobacteria bacterium]|nr:hypothetical protein [Alphaproteobacteria bacterium]
MIKIGLIGHPIRHSLSPRIHQLWLSLYGMDGVYTLLEGKTLTKPDLGRYIQDGFCGFNITMPFKTAVIPFVDFPDELAHTIGAINTIRATKNGTEGTNTDALAIYSLLKDCPPFDRVVILGTGGAARATAWACAQRGDLEIKMLMRDVIYSGDGLEKECQGATLFVNATPIGMHTEGGGLGFNLPQSISPKCLVVDWVYFPKETNLLIEAKKRNLRCVSGLELFVAQAQESFYYWFSIRPDTASLTGVF